MKKCTKCEKEKDEISFQFKNKELQKRSTICSDCQKEYKKKHYHENKQQHYERNKKQEKRLKELYFSLKSGRACVKCGEDDICCIDFHHINPLEKEYQIPKMIKLGSLKKLENEISKCTTLCANCHRKLHYGRFKLLL
jgi:hypothetical protein